MTPDLHHGDCLDVLPTLRAHSIDAIICDLPYGTTQNKWDAVIPIRPMWKEVRRVLKPGAPFITTACQPFSSILVASNLRWFRYEWVWEKNKSSGHLNAGWRPLRAHEDVLVFCDRKPPYNPQMTAGHEPGHFAIRTGGSECYGAQRMTEYGGSTIRQPRSVIRFPIINNDDPEKWHPTQKPVELFEYLVKTYTREGDIVLDIAMGSGTTGEACANLDRRFVGIERDAEIFEKAQSRLVSKVGQLRLLA